TLNQIRYITAGYGRDDLLNHRPEWDDAVIYGVAARLLILRHHILEGGVLLADEALEPIYGCGLGGRVGDESSPQRSSGGQPPRPTENRTPAEFTHADPLLICSLAGEIISPGHRGWLPSFSRRARPTGLRARCVMR